MTVMMYKYSRTKQIMWCEAVEQQRNKVTPEVTRE